MKLSPIHVLLVSALLNGTAASAFAQAIQVPPEYFGADAVLVNFDTTPAGAQIPSRTLLGSIYGDWGVTFGPTNYVCNWCGIATSPPNRCTSGSPPCGGIPITCEFPGGVSAVGAYGFDFVLSAYDKDGLLLGTCSYTDGTAGLFGDNELAFLGLASVRPIYRAEFNLYWSQQCVYGFEIDDLRFISGQLTGARGTTWGSLKAIYR
jgi:hypothetical protein